LKAAQEKVRKLEKAVVDLLDRKEAGEAESARSVGEQGLAKIVRQSSVFTPLPKPLLEALDQAPAGPKAAVKSARERLAAFGIARVKDDGIELTSLRPGTLTAFEAAQLEHYNAAVLTNLVFPGMLSGTYQVNFVDQRLAYPKNWRDVYQYADGRLA